VGEQEVEGESDAVRLESCNGIEWQMGGKMGSWDGMGWAVERLMGSFGEEEKRGGWGGGGGSDKRRRGSTG